MCVCVWGGGLRKWGVTLEGFGYEGREYKVSRKKGMERSFHPKSCVTGERAWELRRAVTQVKNNMSQCKVRTSAPRTTSSVRKWKMILQFLLLLMISHQIYRLCHPWLLNWECPKITTDCCARADTHHHFQWNSMQPLSHLCDSPRYISENIALWLG